MEPSKYIGRVGALAVALGIGTALATGSGIAYADDGGHHGKTRSHQSHSTHSATSNSAGPKSTGPKSAGSKATTRTKPTRRDPLSKLRSQLRKDVKTNLDNVADALKRTRTQLDKPRPKFGTKTATPVITHSDNSKRTSVTRDSATTVPETLSTSPRTRRVQRPTVTVKLDKDTDRPTTSVAESRAENLTRKPAARLETVAAALSDALPKVAPPRAEAIAPKITPAPVVSALLATVGLSPLAAGTNPGAPGPSPALWGLMAWARRESARSLNPNGISLVSAKDAASVVAEGTKDEVAPTTAVGPNVAVQTDDPTPKPQVPTSLTSFTQKLGWVTGAEATGHWFVSGTDLGIMWNSGYTDPDTGKPVIYTLFGDTYSGPGMTGDWRNNVLFRTSDFNLADGLQFSDAVINAGARFPGDPNGTPQWYGTGGNDAGAAQIIYDPGYTGLFGTTYTMIPTSGIAIEHDGSEGGYRQYATVMSIRTWDNPGSWTTNYSGIAYSDDGGKTWTVDKDTVRSSGWLRASTSYTPGDEHFQQNALVMSDDENDPYVYVYGTPSGRQGSAYLARVNKDQITDLDAYEYWSGADSNGDGKWVNGDPSAAVPVFGSSEKDFLPQLYKVIDTFTLGFFSKIANGIWVGGLPTNGNVSEMSVQYNEYLGKYVVLYTDGGNNVVMRVSDSPQGEWSDTTTLVQNNLTTNTGMYAPMVHPMSGTHYFDVTNDDGAVQDNSQYLYYNLSYWGDYNVRLMRTDLSTMKTVSV